MDEKKKQHFTIPIRLNRESRHPKFSLKPGSCLTLYQIRIIRESLAHLGHVLDMVGSDLEHTMQDQMPIELC